MTGALKGCVKRSLIKILLVFVFLGAWQIGVMVFGVKEFILPSPIATFAHLVVPELASKYSWFTHILTTVTEICVGFVVTTVAAILIASLMILSKLIDSIATPLIAFFNSLPKIALAPLFLIWFGYGIIPTALIAMMISFFPIVINTYAGLNDVDPDLLDLIRYLHSSKWQLFLKIRLPNCLPYIFSGLRISSTLCVVGAIVGEFVASESGLGYLMMTAEGALDTPVMFASLVLISLFGLALFGSIRLLERLLMPWQVSER